MSLNLHDVAVEVIQELNSNVSAQWYRSTGNAVNADGSLTPTYAVPATVSVQMQAASQRDLRQVNALNLQGRFVSLWLDGQVAGVIRLTQQGGDRFVINEQTWLTLAVPENWLGPGWSHCVAQLQVTP